MHKIFTLIVSFSFLIAKSQTVQYVIDEMKSIAKTEQAAAYNSQRNLQTLSNASNNYDVKFYRCEWEIDPALIYIKGKITNYFTITSATNMIVYDLMSNLVVDSIMYKNNKISFLQNSNNTISVNFPSILNSGSLDSVSIYYKGAPNATGNGSFNKTLHNNTPVLWTLSEPYGARDWWPCKDALGDKADSLEIIVTCPAAYRTSSIGLLLKEEVVGSKRVMHYKHNYPITSYLVAIACTDYVTTPYTFNVAGTPIKFENWTYPESVNRFISESYGIEQSLNWFTGFYGPYPFINERYAQTQFSWGGGMEHQTNSFVVNPGHLLQAHELAHQWFGDKTTCGSWKDIWVNEGFASFSHWLYFQNHFSPIYYGIRQEYHDEVTSDSTGSVYVNDTTDIDRVFSWRWSYVKGSYILHMLRGMLGDQTFFNCMKAYSNDSKTKYAYAKTEDVKRVFEQVSGKNLTEFFKDWIYGEGWPMYHINWYVNKNGFLNIKVNQRQSHPSVSFFEMPLQLQFKNATLDTTITVDVQQNGQLFTTKLNFIPDTVLVDPELWLLSKNNTQTKSVIANNQTNIIQVYPIPANNENWNVLIKNPTFNNYSVQLINTLGQILYKSSTSTTGADVLFKIPNQLLAKGSYSIVIFNNKEKINTTQVVK